MNAGKITLRFLNQSDNKPIQGIAIRVTLFSKHKNNYRLIPAKSDADGYIILEEAYLSSYIEKTKSMYVMDYSSNLDDCEDNIEISTLTNEEAVNYAENRNILTRFFGIEPSQILSIRENINHNYKGLTKTIKLNGSDVYENIYLAPVGEN